MNCIELVIKLGDGETCIYKKGGGLVLKEASMIAFSKQGNKISTIEVGNSAKDLIGKTDGSIWVESPFKNGVIDNLELASLLLKKFLNVAFKYERHKIKAIFLVNCSLTADEKRDFEMLAMNVDIFDYKFVPCVVSSLIGASKNINEVSGKMIVDLGADCTEIAVVSNCSIIKGYSIALGGSVIDSAIVSSIFDDYGVVISEVTAEKIKKQIGSLHRKDVANITFTGYDALTREVKENTVFARDLYQIFDVFYNKVIDGIIIVLNQLSADLLNDVVKNGIVLCGGNSLVTGIETYFKKKLQIPISTFEQPELLCMQGASTLLNDSESLKKIVTNN